MEKRRWYSKKHYLYDNDLSTLKILENKDNKFIYHSMELKVPCLWSGSVLIKSIIKYKLIIYYEGSIKRW